MKTLPFIIVILLSQYLSLNQKDQPGKTQIISLLTERADPAGNIIYSPAFRAAWTLLREDIVKEDIRLKKPVEIVSELNKSPFRPASEKECVIHAGLADDGIVEEIKKSMKDKFNLEFNDLDSFATKKEAIICFAYLKEEMKFIVPFETLKWKFGTESVSCFGITKSDERKKNVEKELIRKQVLIYDYRNPDDFIAVIKGADQEKEVILAKTEFRSSLQFMKELIYDRIEQTFGDSLENYDELIIPKINISVSHSYDELLGKFLDNRGFKDYFFVKADHQINFSMDESGAIAQATGTIVKMKGPVPRIYAFDKPFVLILRDKRLMEPAIVAWAANAEFLVKSD